MFTLFPQVNHNNTINNNHIVQTVVLFDWLDFFPGVSKPNTPELQYKNFTNDQHQAINNNAYVLSCYFFDLTRQSSGGAIYIKVSSSIDLCILIESTSFSVCQSQIYGAAIFIQNANTALHSVCGYNCSSSYHDSFCNIYSANKNINSAVDCSTSSCKATEEFTMFHYGGKINITRVNISNNQCKFTSALSCGPTKTIHEENNIGNIVYYCSFSQNNATNNKCIRFFSSAYDYAIIRTNIIKNEQSEATEGLIYSVSKTIITDSCIMENIGSPIFHNTNGGFTLINCSVDENINSYLSSPPNTSDKNSKTFINGIKFIELGMCQATIDNLIPIIMEPGLTLKQRCYTWYCEDLIKHSISQNMISIFKFSLLIFNPSNHNF